MGTMAVGRIPVQLLYDEEAKNWHFAVPSLHIVGGGDASDGEALDHAADAIAFTLEADEVPEANVLLPVEVHARP